MAATRPAQKTSGAALKVFAATTVLLALVHSGLCDDGGWKDARASFYGDDGGATIHEGSCLFGPLDGDKGTGWDIAALSDHNDDFDGSCGVCYEVKCRRANFQDGYGQNLDRTSSEHCPDENKVVIVRITDACPCYYPNNAYSNQRWCCGDMRHIDLSYTAFDKISNQRWGVVGVKYRRVQCPAGTPQNSEANDKRNHRGIEGSY